MRFFKVILTVFVWFALPMPLPARALPNPDILPVERTIAAAPYEIAVGYSAHGIQQWQVTSHSPDLFWATDHQWTLIADGGLLSHNHPEEGHCVAQTYDDIANAAYYHLAETRAVSMEQGVVYVHVLRNPRHVYPLTEQAFKQVERGNLKRYDTCRALAQTWLDLGFDAEVIHD